MTSNIILFPRRAEVEAPGAPRSNRWLAAVLLIWAASFGAAIGAAIRILEMI